MKNKGKKFDGGKLPWHLLAWDAIEQVVEVLRFGANKYAPRNWEQGIDYDRLFDAILRHLTAWWSGETYDPETKINHLAHAICDLMFLLAYSIRGKNKFDNRPKV